jgi:hypothetical protein
MAQKGGTQHFNSSTPNDREAPKAAVHAAATFLLRIGEAAHAEFRRAVATVADNAVGGLALLLQFG